MGQTTCVSDRVSTGWCCRRPVDPYSFRPSWINSSAAAVGWDWDYLLGPEDLEAERLFDYGLLAPVDSGYKRCEAATQLLLSAVSSSYDIQA